MRRTTRTALPLVAGILLAGALLTAAPAATQALAFSARVTSVADGDSFKARRPGGGQVTVRLYGIDAPEYRQPYGGKARARLGRLIRNRRVDIEPMDTDRYGRTVALVREPGGALVNEVLVAEGLAWVYGRYCHDPLCQTLRRRQEEARSARAGLWADARPVPPEDWRREHRQEEWRPVKALKRLIRAAGRAIH